MEGLRSELKALKQTLTEAQEAIARIKSTVADDREVLENDLRDVEKSLRESADDERRLLVTAEDLEDALEAAKKNGESLLDVKEEPHDAHSLVSTVEADLQARKVENQFLTARLATMAKVEEGDSQLIEELTRCKMDLASSIEEISMCKRKMKRMEANSGQAAGSHWRATS